MTLLLVTCYFQGVKKFLLLPLLLLHEGSGHLSVSIASISVDLSHTPTTPPQPRKKLQQLCGRLSSALAHAASAGHKRPSQEGELQRVANEVSLPHLPLPLLAVVKRFSMAASHTAAAAAHRTLLPRNAAA
jgi:hypothetical protein